MLTVLHSARDQLHFFQEKLGDRLKLSYLKDYVTYGYVPDKRYPAGSMGYTPSYGANPDGGVPFSDYVVNLEETEADKDYAQLQRSIRLCREKGITPVLVSTPTTDAYLLSLKTYEALFAPVKELAAQEGVLYLDFNLSRFRVSSLTAANYSDTQHMNSSGAELFTPLLAEVVQKALAGGDVSGYFFGSYEEMVREIDRVASVRFKALTTADGIMLEAESLHGPDVTPTYRFFIKAEGEGYEPLVSADGRCSLEGLEPGAYKVRVEACGASGLGCDAYFETSVTIIE
jgi:hypothetical protein